MLNDAFNNADNDEVLHASQGLLQSLVWIEKEWPEPQTLKDFLDEILRATKEIDESIRLYDTKQAKHTEHTEQTEHFKEFLSKVRGSLLNSIEASTTNKWTLDAIKTLFDERVPTLKEFYKKIKNLFIKDSDLQKSVKELLETRDLDNKVLIFLIFLIRSFLDAPDIIEENEEGEETKYFLELPAQDQGDINLKKGHSYNFKVFAVFNIKRPTNTGEYFEIVIPKGMEIKGRFYSLIDPDDKDNLLLPPYMKFIIENIEENKVKVIRLRFATDYDLENLKEGLNREYQTILQQKLRVSDNDDDNDQVKS